MAVADASTASFFVATGADVADLAVVAASIDLAVGPDDVAAATFATSVFGASAAVFDAAVAVVVADDSVDAFAVGATPATVVSVVGVVVAAATPPR